MSSIIQNADGDGLTELMKTVLINPMDSYNELFILTGYASSAMLKRHIELLSQVCSTQNLKIRIVVGMTSIEGLSLVEHKGFLEMVKSNSNIQCSYIMTGRKPCHSKLYIWLKEGVPMLAFAGSANYSQKAFFGIQNEMMLECNPNDALDYFNEVEADSAYCDNDEIEDMVLISSQKELQEKVEQIEDGSNQDYKSEDLVRLSFITKRTNDVGSRSSLNWGQREGRDPNQAYIPIPRNIAESDFFPPKKTVFTIMTDDGFVFQCVTAQNSKDDVPKAIETCNDNSELGLYFRKRLGLKSGEKVTRKDLDKYGRTYVNILNLHDGTYYMEFRKPQSMKLIIDEKTPIKM